MTVLKNKYQKHKKSAKNFKKCANINAECDVKKQNSQSEVRAVSTFTIKANQE